MCRHVRSSVCQCSKCSMFGILVFVPPLVHTNSPDSKVKSPKYKWCTMLHSTSFVLWLNFKQNSIILCRLKTCSNSFKFYLVKLIIHKLNLNMYVAVWGNRHPLMMLFTILLYKYKKKLLQLENQFYNSRETWWNSSSFKLWS